MVVDFALVVESAPDAVLIVNGEGQITLVNAETERMFGYPRNELLGKSIEILVPESFRGVHKGHRANYTSKPRVRPMSGGLNIMAQPRLGGAFPVDISLSPMKDGCTIVSVRDVTERRRMESELQVLAATLEQRAADLCMQSGILQSILDSMGDGVIVLDQTGKLMLINPAARRLYPKARMGAAPSELAEIAEVFGLFRSDRVTPFPADELPLIRVLRGEAVDDMEAFIRPSDGAEGVWTSVAARPLKDGNGRMTGGVLVIRDMTARKSAAEAQLAGQEEERKRIARELHDAVSQSLCVLILDIEMIRQEIPDYAEPIRDRIILHHKKLMELSEDVGRLARRLHPSILERIGLREAMKQLCNEFTKREGIQVEFLHDEMPELFSEAVAACLYRVAQESLRNIAQHAHTNHATVTLTTTGAEMHLSIEDAGVGFNPEAVKGKARLGLISIQERVRQAGGRFSLDSRPGIGTRIDVHVSVSDKRPVSHQMGF